MPLLKKIKKLRKKKKKSKPGKWHLYSTQTKVRRLNQELVFAPTTFYVLNRQYQNLFVKRCFQFLRKSNSNYIATLFSFNFNFYMTKVENHEHAFGGELIFLVY